jgi:hypothetical protein
MMMMTNMIIVVLDVDGMTLNTEFVASLCCIAQVSLDWREYTLKFPIGQKRNDMAEPCEYQS